MKKHYTKPKGMQIMLEETDVIACSGEKLAYAENDFNDDSGKVYW